MSLVEVVEWSSVLIPFQETAIDSVKLGLRLDPIRHRIYGDDARMSILENEGVDSPWESGWKPGQIYEICLFESVLKDQLIHNLRHAFKDHLFISDQHHEFRNLGSIQAHLDSIAIRTGLLIIDISEILHLDYIKDFEKLRTTIGTFYESLERLAKTGVMCVVFVNYFYYYQIFQNIVRPNVIQVFIHPSEIFPFWKLRVSMLPELKSWQSLYQPSLEKLPYFL